MMSVYHFHTGRLDDAIDMIKRYHYSRRAPSNIQFIGTLHDMGGLFGDFGAVVAACVFSIPPTRWSEPVLELSRLVRAEKTVPLTMLIAKSCVQLKRRGYDLLVSFADNTHGHHGGVYQAASWEFAGERPTRMDGLIVDGIFIPGRSCNSRWGTQSVTKLAGKITANIEPHYDSGKFLYYRTLGPCGRSKARRLGLSPLPYPKPNVHDGFDL